MHEQKVNSFTTDEHISTGDSAHFTLSHHSQHFIAFNTVSSSLCEPCYAPSTPSQYTKNRQQWTTCTAPPAV